MKWTDIAFFPQGEDLQDAAKAWAWLIPEPWRPLVVSMLGGIFLEKASGGVFWLECAMGTVEPIADSAEQFNEFIGSTRDEAWHQRIDEWFLPGFVEQLHEAGKIPGPGQCYGMTILPIFEEGRFTIDNAFVLSAREWLAATGSMHEQMRGLPDGAKVQLKIGENP